MRTSLCCFAIVLASACDEPSFTRLPDAAPPIDAGRPDAGADAGVDSGPGPTSGPPLYTVERRHSTIPIDIAERLRTIAGRGVALNDDLFIKVGDSITRSPTFLACFAGPGIDLDGRTELQPSIDRFLAADAGGTTPFDRISLAAADGWSANGPLVGSVPSPLDQEHAAVAPRFAVVMFGTNDVGFRSPEDFARDLWTIADLMIERGTIPLLSTFPPRDDSILANAGVPLFNLAIRALAQGRGLPLVDYHRELLPLPRHGLGPDGIHPDAAPRGGCDFGSRALESGANVRNLITIEQLDRVAAVLAGDTPDAAAVRLEGTGAPTDPFVVQSLPFAAMGDTASSPHRTIDAYGACDAADEAGPELVYRIEIGRPGMLTAAVLSETGVDADVHLLADTLEADSCVARDDRVLTISVSPGTYFVVADTFVDAGGVEAPGEYLMVIMLE